jgi:peptidyl-prolyl cis-trans isomerase B (cyclophilin B)
MTKVKKYAQLSTSKGSIEIELFNDEVPYTVNNFCELANRGFYNGLSFHRVIPNTLIQTGCPIGDGTGNPGYRIKNEKGRSHQFHDQGVVSMANSGKDTGGSQFFICLNRQNTAHLDGSHTCFGKVVKGLNIIHIIEQGDRVNRVSIKEMTEDQMMKESKLKFENATLRQANEKLKEWNGKIQEVNERIKETNENIKETLSLKQITNIKEKINSSLYFDWKEQLEKWRDSK